MRRIAVFSAAVVAAGNIASAQWSQDGPLLIAPGSNGGSYSRGDAAPYVYDGRRDREGSDAYSPESADPNRYGSRRYGNSEYLDLTTRAPRRAARDYNREMRVIAEWYANGLGRQMSPGEERHWSQYLRSGDSHLTAVASILGGDEYFHRAGGRFDSWVAHMSQATSRDVSPQEAAEWREAYRRSRDPVATRTEIAHHFVTEHEELPPVAPSRGYYGGGGRGEVPWYAQPVVRHDQGHAHHDHGHAHEHGAAYGPVGHDAGSPAGVIAGWYGGYLGREATPQELERWLSHVNRGKSIDEVHASILGSDEYYARAGGSPGRWVDQALQALGQRPGGQATHTWVDRLRRLRGDRFQTSLEMIRAARGEHHHDHDGHDDDD